ncbi:uncharacterized protein N7483_005634 [Penicillium malachiteum]|uniref:uncharacterized protein n=1 Tax=Penicillium malachiteum TaxID=1324776 RepID=UPI0025495E93|nr:uncharacterized protein N7483_005634 [Penicillium malachiteum]KAJ5731126.1 hypothetical protein N7483_005634 [Penicillium malachiteum]
MPPIRNISAEKNVEQEGKVLLALQAIQKGQIKSLRAAARLFSVPESTLRSRAHGIQSRVDTRPNGHKLTQLEEDPLIEWIISMDSRGAAPRPATLRVVATPPPTVSKNWPSTFINRREEIRTRVSRQYDYQRALNEDPKSIQAWFTTVQQVIDKNGIQPEDIYNLDETGFAMGLISTQTVVTRQEYYGRRAIVQPGNREWVTAIEAICVDGYSLPPCVIFKGKVAIASWFDNLPKDWRFEVSANGWTTDDIGLRWLEKLFIPSTNSRVRGRFRLLILDGHGSHLTPQFDRICSENNIIPLCMPLHSSHLLQPLDVGCFSVLKITYGRFISDLARTGYNHIDKLDFLADFQRARLEAFKPATIQNSFIATGLVPIDAEKVLSKLNISLRTPTPPGTQPGSRSSQFSPKTPRTVVQLQKQASMLKDLLRQRSNSPLSPSKLMLDQIIKGHCISLHNTALLAQENANLRAVNEKKRQKRSRSTRQVPCEQGLTVEEGLQLLTQLELPVEAPAVEPHTQVELPIQPNQPAPRAQPRCSGCREAGHRINVYHCRRAKLAPPVFNIVSDRRGTYPISVFLPAYTFLLPPFVISLHNPFITPLYLLFYPSHGCLGFFSSGIYALSISTIIACLGITGGRTAWSSTVSVHGRNIAARYWYDGQYINNAKEDAAEVALQLLNQQPQASTIFPGQLFPQAASGIGRGPGGR